MRDGRRCEAARRGPRIFARMAHVSTCVCACERARALVLHARMLMIVLQNERGNTRPGPRRGPGEVGGGGEERIEEANSTGPGGRQQCRPRSGPDGGTRGHIPRWLCLRNAVGAPLRRLPPSFFINRSHLPVLAKRNPLITACAR